MALGATVVNVNGGPQGLLFQNIEMIAVTVRLSISAFCLAASFSTPSLWTNFAAGRAQLHGNAGWKQAYPPSSRLSRRSTARLNSTGVRFWTLWVGRWERKGCLIWQGVSPSSAVGLDRVMVRAWRRSWNIIPPNDVRQTFSDLRQCFSPSLPPGEGHAIAMRLAL